MKKFAAILLTVLLGLNLAACGQSETLISPLPDQEIVSETESITNETAQSKTSIAEAGTVIDSTDSYTVYELPVYYDDLYIYGELYLPNRGQEKYAAMIFSHWLGGDHTAAENNAVGLAEEGIAAYVFDFCGGGPDSVSSNTLMDMTVLTEVNDLNAVIDFIQTLDCIDSENIFLSGLSQGGLVAALVASERPEDIQGLVLLYPGVNLLDIARRNYPDIHDVPEQTSIVGVPVSKQYYEDLYTITLYDDILGFTKDVLLLHGDKDTIVPISYSVELEQVYESAELITLSGAGHSFHGADDDKATRHMVEYIRAHELLQSNAETGNTPGNSQEGESMSQIISGDFAIRNIETGKNIRPYNAGVSDGNAIVLYPHHKWKCVTWQFEHVEEAIYQLRNVYTQKTFEPKSTIEAGVSLWQQPMDADSPQWEFIEQDGGVYAIKMAGTDLYITISSGRKNSPIILMPYEDSDTQRWELIEQYPRY